MGWTLVTGGAKRLGAHICVELAREGYDVVVHYNNSKEEASQIVEKCKEYAVNAKAIHGDFSTDDGILDFVNRYRQECPATQNIVHNVGNYLIKSALNTDLEEWNSLIQTNLTVPFVLNRELITSIVSNKGCILHIGVNGLSGVRANTNSTVYKMTKMALLMLTRSLAKELASEGVRVNMVSPGYLDIAIDLPDDLTKLPMHRPGTCSEVSRVVTFLLNPQNSYITGQNIEVAGGVGL